MREVAHISILIADIYQEAGLPLWLHPYEVLVTSSYTALIETIHDTVILTALLLRSEILASNNLQKLATSIFFIVGLNPCYKEQVSWHLKFA